MSSPALNKPLQNPPIQEVICGFLFESAAVDVLDLGVYWDLRKNDYPFKEVHPALNESVIQLGTPTMRAWLLSQSAEFVLQLQHDRFYLNWRNKGTEYPRFSDPVTGLKHRALEEWQQFGDFVSSRTGAPINLTRIELAKVDVLVRGKHWNDMADLCNLMKVAKVFQDVQAGEPTGVHLRLSEGDAMDTTVVSIDMLKGAVRLETRVISQLRVDLETTLTNANKKLNTLFFGLISDAARFGAKEG